MILEIEYINNLTSDIWEMKLNGDFPFNNVQAGQFINIRIKDSYDHLLRRPISIAEANTDMQSLTIVFRVVGQGTKWLSQRQKGDKLDVMGPLGVGFLFRIIIEGIDRWWRRRSTAAISIGSRCKQVY